MNTAIAKRGQSRVAEVKDTSAKVVETCSVNDSWRQGDIEIRFIGESQPERMHVVPTPTQLAPGETKGSRHMLEADAKIEAFEFNNASPLEGPVLLCPDGLTVSHPEHGDVTINEPGLYAVTYQRAIAEELSRQAD